MIVAGWVCLLWAAASAGADVTKKAVFKAVGDTVVLEPGIPPAKESVVWFDDDNIAVEWDATGLDVKRHFQGHVSLNTSTGALTITRLTREHSAVYKAEVDGTKGPQISLTVMFPVPMPTVLTSCDAEMTSCALTCDGNTTGADTVAYTWNIGNQVLKGSSKEQRISKEDSVNITTISCELENAVSQESSPSIANPFTPADRHVVPPDNVKISAGLTVCISMLATVLLLALIHRWKSGRWFYEEDHLPCQPDFWRRVPSEDPARNGNVAQARGEQDESPTVA